jgi:choice-of-anchor B domain-containing protein
MKVVLGKETIFRLLYLPTLINSQLKFSILVWALVSQCWALEQDIVCDNSGMAGTHACNNINLASHLDFTDIGGIASDDGNDIWGWTDPLTQKEYALMGTNSGTSFVDVSNPSNPIYLGKLPPATSNSVWRDIKTYGTYAYIVSEATGHGMQIFDLTQLRSVNTPPQIFSAPVYSQFGHAHNIVINESSGFAYAVGTNTCSGGLHMMNLGNPANPTFASCFSADGFTHDAQCVNYHGPDVNYQNKEICFNSNVDTLTIVDVSDKSNSMLISRTSYTHASYVHQGWLSEDQRYFLLGDENDELNFGNNSRTIIWDLADLNNPLVIGEYLGPHASIDHNIYVKGDYAYMTNYTSGLSIVNITDIANANLTEVAYFDTYPNNDNANFNGAWSSYPYFASGNIIVSDINTGLYVLTPTICLKTAYQCFVIEDTLFKSSFEN